MIKAGLRCEQFHARHYFGCKGRQSGSGPSCGEALLPRGLAASHSIRPCLEGLVSIALFNAESNETRAKTRQADDLRLRNRASLLDLAADLKDTGDDKLANQLKRESDHLFSRDPISIRSKGTDG